MKTLALIMLLTHKSVTWTPDLPSDHVAFYTMYMSTVPITKWYRLGSTITPPFQLPTGPYTRSFAVTATNDIGESFKSNILVTHL